MSSLSVACLVYLALLLPVVATGVWSWHRYSAPLLLDVVDADEMVVGAVHRLSTVAYALLASGFVAWLAPDRFAVAGGVGAAVLHAWAKVMVGLGLAHALALRALLNSRRRREQELTRPRVVWGPPAPTPVYTAPVHAAPVYAAPVYAAPAYTAPAYTASAYTGPRYAAPTYYAPPVATAPLGSFAPPWRCSRPLYGSQPFNEWAPPVAPPLGASSLPWDTATTPEQSTPAGQPD